MSLFDDLTIRCLVIEERYPYYKDYIEPEFRKRFGIQVRPFFALKKPNPTLERESAGQFRLDTDDRPPIFPYSTNYPTWVNKPNAYQCWQCHKEILLSSQKENLSRVMLIEDDIFFEKDTEEVLKKFENDFYQISSDSQFNMIYLGAYNKQREENRQITDNLIEVKSVGGFHAVILHKRIIDRLLKFEPYGPFDEISSRFVTKAFSGCFAVNPSIISQLDDNYSFIEEQVLKKPSRFE